MNNKYKNPFFELKYFFSIIPIFELFFEIQKKNETIYKLLF